jgi:hypothetical protein
MISRSALLKSGWTPKLIREHLGEPDDYVGGKLYYDLQKVLTHEYGFRAEAPPAPSARRPPSRARADVPIVDAAKPRARSAPARGRSSNEGGRR